MTALFTVAAAAEPILPRHEQEARSLSEPDRVLAELPAKIDAAQARHDWEEVALLKLAQSNACRVVAQLDCWRTAAHEAQRAARQAGNANIETRGLIMEASVATSLQEYPSAERLLAEAEARLRDAPHPLIAADLFLSYSSLSHSLGNYAESAQYATQGLRSLENSKTAQIFRARLLRNLATAYASLDRLDEAAETIAQALEQVTPGEDPKLVAELRLQLAHLAHARRDFATMREHASKALDTGKQLRNGQLLGLAHELMATVALEQDNDVVVAEREVRAALAAFQRSGSLRDERHALRQLTRIVAAQGGPETSSLVRRLVSIEEALDDADQAHVAANLEARLVYARHGLEFDRLQAGVEAARERQHLYFWLGVLVCVLLAVLAMEFRLQRRAGARLAKALRRARENEARNVALMNNIPAAIAHFDEQQRYVQANAHLGEMLNRPAAALMGRTLREVHGELIHTFWKPHLEAVLRGETARFSSSEKTSDGTRYLDTVFVPDRDEDGAAVGFYALTFDVTELTVAKQDLERLLRIDSLTGVANRRHFEERLDAVLAHARRASRSLALIAIDLDKFKAINDTHGHAAGDAVLREFVARVLGCVRKDDFLARLGGDEFVLLVEEPPGLAAEIIAMKLLDAMQTPIVFNGLSLCTTISLGVALGHGGLSPDTLLASADEALYDAKREGRGTFRIRDLRPLPAS